MSEKLNIIKEFFNLDFIKETKIKTGIRYYIREKENYSEYITEINDFIEFIELKDNDIFRNFLMEFEIALDIIIHLQLNSNVEEKEISKMVKEIRDKKFEIDMPGFYEETDIECFIVEVFIQGNYLNDEIIIKIRNLEVLNKDMIIEYFKILKNVLEKYYKN